MVTQGNNFNDLHYKLRLTTTGKSFASLHWSKSVVVISIDVNGNQLLSMALSRRVGRGGGGRGRAGQWWRTKNTQSLFSIHSDTYWLSTRNVLQTRVLQGISEQKLKSPSSPPPLSLYWKQRQTSICIKHVSFRSPHLIVFPSLSIRRFQLKSPLPWPLRKAWYSGYVFPAFRLSRLHLSNTEHLLRKYLQWWDYFDYI